MSDSIHTIGCRESFVKSKAQYIVYFIQKDALYIVLRMKRPNAWRKARGRTGATPLTKRLDFYARPSEVAFTPLLECALNLDYTTNLRVSSRQKIRRRLAALSRFLTL